MSITETSPDNEVGAGGTTTAYRTCPLCEATCGLELTVRDGAVTRIRGDRDDVFSHGFICPKGSTLRQLHDDPDRLRRPLVRGADGELHEATWDEAFAEVRRRLTAITDEHGRDAVAAYIGNPTVHSVGTTLFVRPLLKALGTRNIFSASTVDQRPKELSSALLFGTPLTIPVPDIDRTDYLLILGANPYESNGSLATAPDWPGRLEALQARGGRLVVADPRHTRTARQADWHLPIRPGSDALLLAAVVTELAGQDRLDLGDVATLVRGVDRVMAELADFTPDAVAEAVGITADDIRRLARELADAETAVVYGRIGTTTAEFGTLTSWLVDVVNLVTGNLDRAGGAMLSLPATGGANTRGELGRGRGTKLGRYASRVSGRQEVLGELPAGCLAEEIDTPGEGQVRALVTVAGNPVLSTPDSERLDAALATLDFYVAVDIYVNETTRHADVILPPPSTFERDHYDLGLYQLAVRNVANYSPPTFPAPDGQPAEWEILAMLALIAQGVEGDAALVDDLTIGALINSAVGDPYSPVHGREPADLLAALEPRRGPERILDFMVRTGPYGDEFGARTDEIAPGVLPLTLDVLLEHPHGVDLGTLAPRLPEALRTSSGQIELDAQPFLDDLPRLRTSLQRPVADAVLVGRRDLRSNNSWMHNLRVLVKGKARCTLQVHPHDAARWGLDAESAALVKNTTGSIVAPIELTEAIRPGVVSLPHGWGHDLDGVQLGIASEHAGVNSNILTDAAVLDELSGTAVLNGIPVTVTPASSPPTG